MAEAQEYLLGTGDTELQRLGLQHRLWLGEAERAWRLAGFGPGQRLLDVGCGPGHASMALAELTGPDGAVHGTDISERFVAHLRGWAAAAGAAHVAASVQDAAHLPFPEASFDGAWSRWVLCFVPDPEAVVRAVAGALRPGACFAVQDYARYDAVYVAPDAPPFGRVFEAIVASWRARGGNPRVGQELPAMMERCGLTVEVLEPVVRIARPTDDLWRWPRTFFDSYLPGLVQQGLLAQGELEAFDAAWREREGLPGAYFHSPPMVRMVARKR